MESVDTKQPLEEENRANVVGLENRIKRLEKRVQILEVIAGKITKANGMKVERYPDGLVIIS